MPVQKKSKRNRLASSLALTMVVGCLGTSTGCTSTMGERVASINPFSSSDTAGTLASSGNDSSNWLNGPKQVGTSLAGGAKTAATSTSATLAGWFGGKKEKSKSTVIEGDETDPTSLAHKAEVTPEVFVANGRLWESTGNFEKAMESYGKALEQSPSDSAALSNIARLHFRQSNHEKAAEYFGQAIKENPEEAGLYNDLGLTLSKLGNHSAAATTIEQALRLSPGSSRYANNLASVKFEAGDTAGALEVLVKNNKPAVAHFNMAYLHYKHGQAMESSRHLNQAIAYAPQAESDPATKRAVERSRELMAQLSNAPGGLPAATIANAAATTAPIKPAAAAPQAPAQTPAPAAATNPTANAFPGTVQPVSGGNTNVNFGNASFRTTYPVMNPASTTATTAVAQTPAAPAPTTAPAASDSAPQAAAPPQFTLPPGFSSAN